MSTLKIQIPVSPETVEREVTLPAYRKDNVSFSKVISENERIDVIQIDTYYGIIRKTFSGAGSEVLTSRSYSDCIPQEFESAFEKVKDLISELDIQHA